MSIEHLLGKVHNVDCLEFMKQLPDNSIDLVVTSPPYNKVGFRGGKALKTGTNSLWTKGHIQYDTYDDNMPEEQYRIWQIDIINEAHRILKDTGSIMYNHKVRRYEGKASHPLEWFLKSKVQFYQEIIWDRGSGPDQNNTYLTPTTEIILWGVKGRPKVTKQNKFSSEVWRFSPDSGNPHPAPFPLTLAYQCINLTTDKGDIVYDPFMGSGTTAVASEVLERRFIGTEISINYIDICNKRIEAERAQLKLF